MSEFFAQLVFWSALAYVILSWSGNVPLVESVISRKAYGLILSAFLIGLTITVINTLFPVIYILIGLLLVTIHRRMIHNNEQDGVINVPANIRYGIIAVIVASICLLFL